MAKKSLRSSKPEDLNRGAWTAMEDQLLSEYVNIHGITAWNSMPQKIGLKRCGKSCRLRWLNYLRPDIKRGNISSGEEDLIIRLHGLLGNRWSLIAGRLPGRTDNEIKNYWNTHLSKKSRTSKTLSKFINKTRKSDRPAADDRLLKVTPIKVTAVRIRKRCNKYVHTHSNHEKFDSTQNLKTSISCSQLYSSTDISMAADPESPSVKIDGQYCFEDFGIEELQKSNCDSFLRPTDNYSSSTGHWMDELQDFLLSEFKEEDFTHFS